MDRLIVASRLFLSPVPPPLEPVVLSPMFLSFINYCSLFTLHCFLSRQWQALIYMHLRICRGIIDTSDRSAMMNIKASAHHRLNLLDLPNELLLIIIEYLPMIDALYSLVGITQRLDQLVLNPLSTNTLNVTCLRPDLLPERVYSLDELTLATLCRTVLPRLHHQISHLIVDQFSIEAVFCAREYSALHSLSLIDIDPFDAFDLFQGGGVLHNLLAQQITSLYIDFGGKRPGEWSTEYSSTLFASVLQSCQRLTKLRFCSGVFSQLHWVELSGLNCQSALLTDLSVCTRSFGECLYLFDGRFPCLSRVEILVEEIELPQWNPAIARCLHNLKRFSLTSHLRTYLFDRLVAPLLRHMINLEELSLFLTIIRFEVMGYLDGVQLREKVLRHMPRMKKCHFSIETRIVNRIGDLVLASNDDIQRSFIGHPFGTVGSFVDVFAKADGTQTHSHSLPHEFYSRCHIYSLPYRFDDFSYLSNSFQGGVFERVRFVWLVDICPFEHDFFRLISQSFPSLKDLHITNDVPQVHKQPANTAIIFPRLRRLGIQSSHLDYAKQFLIDEHCQLPHLRTLRISWPLLMSVTNDFTNATTRLTCSRVKFLPIPEGFDPPGQFHNYFSSL